MEPNDLIAKFIITITEEYLLLDFEGNSFFRKKTCMGVTSQHKIDEKVRRLKKLLIFRKLITYPDLRPINNRQRCTPYRQHNPSYKIITSDSNRVHLL